MMDTRGIRDWGEQRLEEMVDLLRELVEQNSGSANIDGIRVCLERCRRFLAPLGFEFEEVIADDGRLHLVCRRGSTGPAFLFLGHLDTVYEPHHSFQRFWREEERLRGPGVADMKGGVVTLLFAVRYLCDSGLADRCRLTVLLNSDEEISSPSSGPLIESVAPGHQASLVFESGRPNGDIVSARKGVAKFTLHVQGVAAHSGVAHAQGKSAVVGLARLVLELEQLTDYERELTLNVGLISGGEKANIVPEYAMARIDLRFNERSVAEQAVSRIQAIVDAVDDPPLQARLEGGIVRAPWPVGLPGTEMLVERFRAVANELGLSLNAIPTGGGSDGSLTAAVGVPTLDGLGPVGGNLHSVDEWAARGSLAEKMALTAGVLQRWIEEGSSDE